MNTTNGAFQSAASTQVHESRLPAGTVNSSRCSAQETPTAASDHKSINDGKSLRQSGHQQFDVKEMLRRSRVSCWRVAHAA